MSAPDHITKLRIEEAKRALERIGDRLRAMSLEPNEANPLEGVPDNVASVAARGVVEFIASEEMAAASKRAALRWDEE